MPWTYTIFEKNNAGKTIDIMNGLTRVCRVLPTTSRSQAQAEAIGERLSRLPELEAALNEIAAGNGIFGAQALEYKNIARKALGLALI